MNQWTSVSGEPVVFYLFLQDFLFICIILSPIILFIFISFISVLMGDMGPKSPFKIPKVSIFMFLMAFCTFQSLSVLWVC